MSKRLKKHRGNLKLFQKALTMGALCLSVSAIPFSRALAIDANTLPAGGTVVGGSAGFDYSLPNELHINQNTDRVVINWDSFNIGQNALTQFHQNSSSSVAVNRVTGAGLDPTQILGTLKANGKIIVLDRNGVIFGENSVVDVGGIIASTGNIDDAAFMRGDQTIKIFDADQGKVELNGQMTVSDAGLAAFVAPTVINKGVIKAKMGKVQLAGTTSATLDLYGDGLIEVAVDHDEKKTLVENSGMIEAAGGQVLMTASSAKKIIDSTVNMEGIVTVASVEQKGGKIILSGATTKVSGALDASGKTGGGEILVGGDYQGKGSMARAMNTSISDTAVIKANTTGEHGNGGKVIVWADESARFDGVIEAKGGYISGDGGFVETSGKINLGVTGSVDASAMNGLAGSWLLDPSNVTIMGTGGTDISSSGGTVNPPSDSYQISDSSIEAALNAGNNVTITTTNAGGTQSGDISTSGTVSILKTSGANATLTLQADRDILLNNTTITSSGAGGALNVVLNADHNADQSGAIGLSSSAITTNGGYFVAGGGSGTLFGVDGIYGTADDAASTGADNVAAWGNGTNINGASIFSSSISTGAGNLLIKGQSANLTTNSNIGVLLNAASLSATTGQIKITGTGNGNTASSGNYGIQNIGGGITTSSGDITITAQNITTGTSSAAHGIFIQGDVTSSSGAISISGMGSSPSGGNNSGFRMNAGTISSGTNNITITGIAGSGGSDFNITTGAIGDAGQSGSITLNGNTFNIASATVTTTGTAIVKPRTASTTIGLGGGTGTLNLDDVELGKFTAGTLIIGDAVSGTGDIIVDSWDLSGKVHNVELYGNDITFQDTDATAGVDYAVNLGTGNFKAVGRTDGATQNGDITVNGIIRKTAGSSSSLHLSSYRNLIINAGINVSNGIDLPVTLQSNNADTGSGYIQINANVKTTTGNTGILTMGGGSNIATGYAWGNSGQAAGIAINANIGASGVTTTLRGHGYDNAGTDNNYGVYLTGTTSNNSGGYTVTGVGGNGLNNNYGIYVNGGIISSTSSGQRNFTGTGGGTGSNNYGIYVANGGIIRSANGTLNLIGTGGGTGAGTNNYGVYVTGTGSTIASSGSGTVNVTGIRGGGSMANNYGIVVDTANGINTTGTGSIVVNADTVFLTTTNAINSIAALTFKPYTASSTIGLGGGAGTLNLTDLMLGYLGVGTNLIIGDSANGTGDIVVDSWDLSGKTHNVELYGNDITFQDTDATAGVDYAVKLGTGNFTARGKDNGVDYGTITANARFVKALAGSSKLDLLADRDIVFNEAAIDASIGSLNIQLNSDRNANQDGAVYLYRSVMTTNGGYGVIGGGAGTLWGADGIKGTSDDVFSTGADNIAAWGNADYIDAVRLDGGSALSSGFVTNSGDIFVNGSSIIASGRGAILIGGGVLQTTSGNVRVNSSEFGLTSSISNIASQTGSIVVNSASSITLGSNSDIFSTGSATIYLNADSLNTTNTNTIGGASAAGDITLNVNAVSQSSNSDITSTGKVTIKPKTATTSIGLGGGSGSINLTDSELSTISAGTLIIGDSVNGTGDITVDSWDLSGKTHNVELYGNDTTLGGLTLGTGGFKAYAKDNGVDYGDLTVSAAITKALAGTSTFDLRADRNVTFNTGSNIATSVGRLDVRLESDVNYASVAGGDITINNSTLGSNGGNIEFFADGASGITVNNSTLNALAGGYANLIAGGAISYLSPNDVTLNTVSGSSVLVKTTGTGKNITANGQITATASGNSANIAASGNFINGRGSDLFNMTGSGRWLVYSTNPTGNVRNGLTPNAAAIYGGTYDTMAPGTVAAGNRFIFSDAAASAPTITFTADNKIKTYGDANTALTYSVGGFVDADNASNAFTGGVTLSTAVDTASNAGAHTDEIIIANNGLATNLGYKFAFDNGNYLVNKANLTIAADSLNKTYGVNHIFAGTEFTNSALLNSDTISGVTLTSAGAAGAATVAGGPYALVAAAATGTGLGNYNITYVDGTLTVDKANLNVSADSFNKTYGATYVFDGDEFTHGTLYNSDTISGVTLTSAGAAGAATVAGGPYAISVSAASGAGLDNYNISYTNGALTVDKANLTITALDGNKSYGSGYTFTGNEFSNTTLYNSDTVTSVNLASSGASASASGGGSFAITASGATGTGLDNYNISYAAGQLLVNKATLTVTANNQTKTYGTTYTFGGNEYSYSGLINSDTLTGVTLTSAGAAATANAGSHTITASGAAGTGLSNYDIVYSPGTFTVNKANLTIAANNIHKNYGSNYTFAGNEFTNSTLLNADTVTSVTLTSSGAASSATVAGGPYAITASGAAGSGLGNYNISYTSGALTVDKVNLIISANNATKNIGDALNFVGNEFTTSALYNGNAVSNVILTSPGAASGAVLGGYAITASGASGTGLANYNLIYSNGILNVVDGGYTPPSPPVTVPAPSGQTNYDNIIHQTANAAPITVTPATNPEAVQVAEQKQSDSKDSQSSGEQAMEDFGSCLVSDGVTGGCTVH